MAPDRAETIALALQAHRRGLKSPAQQGRGGQLVKELSARTHLDPEGALASVSRSTIDRWIRAYNKEGLKALRPTPRHGDGHRGDNGWRT